MSRQTFSLRYFRNFRVPVKSSDGIKLHLTLNPENGETQTFEAQDLTALNMSLSGVALKSRVKIPQGVHVITSIHFKKNTYNLPGKIVRVQAQGKEFGVAIEFDNSDRAISGKFLQFFIDSFTSKRLKEQLISLLSEEEGVTGLGSDDMYPAVLQIFEEFGKYRELSELPDTLIEATRKIFALENLIFVKAKEVAPFIVYDLQGKLIGSMVASTGSLSSDARKGIEALCLIVGMLWKEREGGIYEEAVRFLQPTAPRRYVMIGSSKLVGELRDIVSKTKFNHSSIFISGDFGVGKTLMAKIIHSESMASDETYHILDLGQVVNKDELHSFFEQLNHLQEGTLVLREIHMAKAETLVTLSEKLKEKRWHQQWRVISTSQVSMQKLTLFKKFSGLFESLAQIKISIPKLSERREDIGQLLSFFLKRECLGRGLVPKLATNDLVHYVTHYDFENNIYALKQFVARMVDLNPNAKVLTFEDGYRLGLLEDEHFQLSQFESALAEFNLDESGYSHEEILAQYFEMNVEKAWHEAKGNTKLAMLRLGVEDESIFDRLKEQVKRAA